NRPPPAGAGTSAPRSNEATSKALARRASSLCAGAPRAISSVRDPFAGQRQEPAPIRDRFLLRASFWAARRRTAPHPLPPLRKGEGEIPAHVRSSLDLRKIRNLRQRFT